MPVWIGRGLWVLTAYMFADGAKSVAGSVEGTAHSAEGVAGSFERAAPWIVGGLALYAVLKLKGK